MTSSVELPSFRNVFLSPGLSALGADLRLPRPEILAETGVVRCPCLVELQRGWLALGLLKRLLLGRGLLSRLELGRGLVLNLLRLARRLWLGVPQGVFSFEASRLLVRAAWRCLFRARLL